MSGLNSDVKAWTLKRTSIVQMHTPSDASTLKSMKNFEFRIGQCNFTNAQWDMQSYECTMEETVQLYACISETFLQQGVTEQTFCSMCFHCNCHSGNEPLAELLEQCQLSHANVQLAVVVDSWMQCAGWASNWMTRCQVSCSLSP